jgi:archaetidylinositol phosphate synthase
LLNKLREMLEPTLARIGQTFASTGVSANGWTGVGLAVSVLAAFVYSSNGFLNFIWAPWNLAAVVGGIILLLSDKFQKRAHSLTQCLTKYLK